MHGPGYGPGYGPPRAKPRSTAEVVTLRILFVLLAIGSWGIFAWLTMLRIAVMRRKRTDWLLFVLCCLVTMGLFIMVGFWGSDPDTEEGNNVDLLTGLGLLVVALVVAFYYLVVDVRFQQELRRQWQSPRPYRAPVAGSGFGFGPAPQGPGQAPTVPGYGYPPQRPGYGYPPVNPAPAPVPPPPAAPPTHHQPPATGPRIDQVRAELDELSDYLRKDREERDR
ncbi:hypothetical protein [Streptomyces qinzhouensis]|uniref:Integral membrane protein n=1 Tax=Streptomyces qinzhouensis TaxID=2599401 RepID=A0A5B8IG79_9ACTN|nr:hypothetical protein [Streptomyces qinzhouensis]QDY77142.1 hypothetical protein FQU76_12135 [Streptomyces qinzhouensis]